MNSRGIFEKLNKIAPLEISIAAQKELSVYDNSGLLFETEKEIKTVVFSLDLDNGAYEYAVDNNADMIITHHPVIYEPIKRITLKETQILAKTVAKGIALCSMHLNLDAANGGIEDSLCCGLSGKHFEIIEKFGNDVGFGRYFEIEPQNFFQFANKIKSEFSSERIMTYGDDGTISKIASFCGAGMSGESLDLQPSADVYVSSDIRHHVIVEAINRGKKVVLIPHYTSEIYGFTKFYKRAKDELNDVTAYLYINNRMI